MTEDENWNQTVLILKHAVRARRGSSVSVSPAPKVSGSSFLQLEAIVFCHFSLLSLNGFMLAQHRPFLGESSHLEAISVLPEPQTNACPTGATRGLPHPR